MSMQVVFIKVLPDLHRRIVESEGELLNEIGDGAVEEGFDLESDAYDELDYRDIAFWAEDAKHPLYALFHGDALHEEYGWNYGPPMYFSPAVIAGLAQRFAEMPHDAWQMQQVNEFLSRAVPEGKGVIVGIA